MTSAQHIRKVRTQKVQQDLKFKICTQKLVKNTLWKISIGVQMVKLPDQQSLQLLPPDDIPAHANFRRLLQNNGCYRLTNDMQASICKASTTGTLYVHTVQSWSHHVGTWVRQYTKMAEGRICLASSWIRERLRHSGSWVCFPFKKLNVCPFF